MIHHSINEPIHPPIVVQVDQPCNHHMGWSLQLSGLLVSNSLYPINSSIHVNCSESFVITENRNHPSTQPSYHASSFHPHTDPPTKQKGLIQLPLKHNGGSNSWPCSRSALRKSSWGRLNTQHKQLAAELLFHLRVTFNCFLINGYA